jgi:glyoxylase-like metal-dependent hydrolase (beta-lactamase superfamily II)
VLDARLDPAPDEPYVMSHPSFALEWPDGRIFLIDLGMEREAALAFGGPIEWLGGADPIEPHASVAESLGAEAARVAGVAFTHLHTDHTSGISALCRAAAGPIRLFQGRLQAERTNFTTRAGAAQLEAAACLRREVLDGAPLLAVPGFPGLAIVPAAGHTPCSQVLIAHVREASGVRTWVFTGDVVNAQDAVRLDLPKPFLYRLLMVPESEARLARMRAFLRELASHPGVGLLVSHDERSLEASGVPLF